MAEERDFEVIDRRRKSKATGRSAAPAAEAEAPPAEAEPAAGPEETAAGPEETAAGPEETAAGPEEVTAGPEEMAAGPEDEDEDEDLVPGRPADVVDIVSMSLGMFNEIAWIKMGLVPDPMSGQIGTDLAQARLAIDCAADLVRRLEPHVDEKTRRDLEVLVQNLKLNFVKQQGNRS